MMNILHHLSRSEEDNFISLSVVTESKTFWCWDFMSF